MAGTHICMYLEVGYIYLSERKDTFAFEFIFPVREVEFMRSVPLAA